jgi:hypothetical protein
MTQEWRMKPTGPGEPETEIFAATLIEGEVRADHHVRSRLTLRLADAVARCSRWLRGSVGSSESSETDQFVSTTHDATTLAVGALTGKLEGQSLEGELKRALIEQAYADARQKNAEARRIEQEVAFERVTRALELCERLGVPVKVTFNPDGTPCIAALQQEPEQ